MKEFEKEDLESLKDFVKGIIKPLRPLPFHLVVELTVQHKIIPMTDSKEDKELKEKLVMVGNEVMKATKQIYITANRSNDVASPLSGIFSRELEKVDLRPAKPLTKAGKGQEAGYPDFQITDSYGRITYLEMKNSRPENIYEASPRNFFFKPSENTKITHDARHLIMGFINKEVETKKWKIIGWKLVDLYRVKVNFKPEFNTDNPNIYSKENIIAENTLK